MSKNNEVLWKKSSQPVGLSWFTFSVPRVHVRLREQHLKIESPLFPVHHPFLRFVKDVKQSHLVRSSYRHSFLLLNMITTVCVSGYVDIEQADAVDFVVEGLDTLTHKELSSRLRLNYCGEYVRYPQVLQNMPITVIDVLDEASLPEVSLLVVDRVSGATWGGKGTSAPSLAKSLTKLNPKYKR